MEPIAGALYEPTPLLRELQILVILARDPGVSQKEISAEVGLVPSMVHNYLHGLSASGWIEFQGPSRRKMRYVLTSLGEERLRVLQGRHAGEACRVLKEIAEFVRSEMIRAAGNGLRRVGVLNCPALAATLECLGKETGLEVVALGEDLLKGGTFSSESLGGLDAILVATDTAREDVRQAIAAAEEKGLRVLRLG
jgi:DNA-binding MarR family transcriptional regulator